MGKKSFQDQWHRERKLDYFSLLMTSSITSCDQLAILTLHISSLKLAKLVSVDPVPRKPVPFLIDINTF